MRADLYNRLYNWKFASAHELLRGDEPDDVRTLVIALAQAFNNCGLMAGNMGIIIDAALLSIMPEEAPTE